MEINLDGFSDVSEGYVYTLVNFNNKSGFNEEAGDFVLTGSNPGYGLRFLSNQLQLYVIPEPSSYGLFIGAAGLLQAVTLRRRRKIN